MLVNDIMTRNPVSIRPTATIGDAVEVIESLTVRHVPVVNEDGELVGMVSDRDLRNAVIPLHRATDRVQSASLRERQVTEVMTGDVLAVHEEEDAGDAVDLMLANQVGAVPVVNGDGVLVGIVSYVDVLRTVQPML